MTIERVRRCDTCGPRVTGVSLMTATDAATLPAPPEVPVPWAPKPQKVVKPPVHYSQSIKAQDSD